MVKFVQSAIIDNFVHIKIQNKVVGVAIYRPRPATAMDKESGACTMSQFPTQAADMVCRDLYSQSVTQSQGSTQVDKHTNGNITIAKPNQVDVFS